MKKPIYVMHDSGLDRLEQRAIECAISTVYDAICYKRGIVRYEMGAQLGALHLTADDLVGSIPLSDSQGIRAADLLTRIEDRHAINLFFTSIPFTDCKYGMTNDYATVQTVLPYRDPLLSVDDRVLAIKGSLWYELGRILGLAKNGVCLSSGCIMHCKDRDFLQGLIGCARVAQYTGVYCQKCQRLIKESA